MKLTSLFFILVTLLLASCGSRPGSSEAVEKYPASTLFNNLLAITGKATLFGHQDNLAYGIGWRFVPGESDVKRTAGDYPAVFGWELGGLELGNPVNLDSVPFDKMRELAIWGHQNGGIITFSWHAYSPVNIAHNSWVTETPVVKHIIPGGSHHEVFVAHLDKVIEFFKTLKTPAGDAIPFIFRPWHEMDGDWFWWGASLTNPEDFRALFRFTIEHMRASGLTNFLVAYSPDRHFSNEQEYLSWYPGDDIVDIVGKDNYYDMRQGEEGLAQVIKKLEIVARYAYKTGKVAAFTETGLDRVPDPTWYTSKLGAALGANEWTRRMAYALVWRNHDLTHFYVPYPEHPAAEDFREFTRLPNIWLLNDWKTFVEQQSSQH